MTSAEIVNGEVRVQFAAPWDLSGHNLYLKAKRLPEARCEFDRARDSYTLSAPARFAPLLGLAAPDGPGTGLPLAPFLFDYQAWIVERALDAKRYAIWADCGLGKTPMGLEWARQVHAMTGGRVAIVCPKQLIHQWQEEAAKFYGGTLPVLAMHSRDEFISWCSGDMPYDRPFALASHHLFVPGVVDELRHCAGVALDESSILKGGGGVIKWNLIKSCRGIEYKLSLTATPAPNDTMEYASQASWLEKLRSEGEILWTFFVRDNKTNEWKVRPHAREAFYRFMASWSIYLRKPSAYGFADQWDLPEPDIVEHRLAMSDDQATFRKKFVRAKDNLIGDERLSMTERSKLSQIAKGFVYDEQKKATRVYSAKPATVAALTEQALSEGRQVLVWTVFDEESEIIMEHLGDIEGVDSLHGKDIEADRESKLEDFRHGRIRALVSKARLLGYGMNFQFCTRMIFSGFDDSFEQFYQAVRRAHRYGSTERLVVHVPIIPELESKMWENLLRKRNQWESDIATQERNYVEAINGN